MIDDKEKELESSANSGNLTQDSFQMDDVDSELQEIERLKETVARTDEQWDEMQKNLLANNVVDANPSQGDEQEQEIETNEQVEAVDDTDETQQADLPTDEQDEQVEVQDEQQKIRDYNARLKAAREQGERRGYNRAIQEKRERELLEKVTETVKLNISDFPTPEAYANALAKEMADKRMLVQDTIRQQREIFSEAEETGNFNREQFDQFVRDLDTMVLEGIGTSEIRPILMAELSSNQEYQDFILQQPTSVKRLKALTIVENHINTLLDSVEQSQTRQEVQPLPNKKYTRSYTGINVSNAPPPPKIAKAMTKTTLTAEQMGDEFLRQHGVYVEIN